MSNESPRHTPGSGQKPSGGDDSKPKPSGTDQVRTQTADKVAKILRR